MCRWLAYVGKTRVIERYVYETERCLCSQALHSHKAKLGVHGDGGGLGWYGNHGEPGLYRNPGPAWNDPNLRELTRHIESELFFAHVRASTGAPNLLVNCHPFRSGRWLFMHNGQIGGFVELRRELESCLCDDDYRSLIGQTDSELMFRLMMSNGLGDDPKTAIRRVIADVEARRRARGFADAFRATFALTDGIHIWAVRWSSDDHAPSLYQSVQDGAALLVSEPLDEDMAQWEEIPANSLVEAKRADNGRISLVREAFL